MEKTNFMAVICPKVNVKLPANDNPKPLVSYWSLGLTNAQSAAYLEDKTGLSFTDGVQLEGVFKADKTKYRAKAPWQARDIFVYATAASGCTGEKMYINGYNNSLSSATGRIKSPLTLNKAADTTLTVEVVSQNGVHKNIYIVTISQEQQPLPWFWIALAGFVGVIGIGLGSFYGYIAYLRSRYKEKSTKERVDVKNPLLEYCKVCKKNVPAMKYIGEDVCPECANWL